MSNKYHNPSGFPENLPAEQIVEERMKKQMRMACESFGYVPLETSAVEYIETISSKGDINKEIYTIGRALGEGEGQESDRALRFDLTVPFARYVAQHYGDLVFPFKRYQIQRVWRGERPQKGRFREFYQADIDIIANEKLPLFFDAEVVTVVQNVLGNFNIGSFTIHINNRKFLQGILEAFSIKNTEAALRIIDKFDKVGFDVTKASLVNDIGISEDDGIKILDILDRKVPVLEIENYFDTININNDLIKEGKEELLEVAKFLKDVKVKNGKFVLNPRIARGLDYYTGSVYETTIDGLEKYGSICSGGRYANLAGKFINKKLPGVGVSIGLTRLLDVIKNEKLATFGKSTLTKTLIGLTHEDQRLGANEIAYVLRSSNINTEVFHNGSTDIGKQLQYRIKKGIDYFLIINNNSTFTLKISNNTEETFVDIKDVIKSINK
ncbi:MAG: histidine--tRNA ligase [bacterium]|nr:histidine--tRNA ligase [bacterium]